MLSFWEKQSIKQYDFVVVGAGIMGCSVAFELREKYKKAKIVVLERGVFPTGASTKNAGFACFGSPTEIFSDIELLGNEKALEIIWQRVEGLKILTDRFNTQQFGYTAYGGHELIFNNTIPNSVLNSLNDWLFPVFKEAVFKDISTQISLYGLSDKIQQMIFCTKEAQIDSGLLMLNYWKLLNENNIQIITGASVTNITGNTLEIYNNISGCFKINSEQIILATNAFIKDLLPDMPVNPGRGQVVLTNELTNLPFKGSFHFDEGYYYFRNVGNRVLFGGGRNLDFDKETTTAFEPNQKIIDDLIDKLHHIILPKIPFNIEQQWQGIMGFSANKKPIIMKLNKHTTYIMSCNGMGVALSPFVAKVAVNAM